MLISRLLVAGIVVSTLVAVAAADDKGEKADAAKLIVGKWQTTKAHKEVPAGSVFEFGKGGKMRMVVKTGGEEDAVDADYTVEGTKLRYKLKDDRAGEKTATITTISNDELVLSRSKDDFLQFKRVR